MCRMIFEYRAGLSLNFGLRYEYWAPYTELYGNLANLVVSPGFTRGFHRHAER